MPGATLEVHYKLFGTDGVSLQSQELSKELRARGWAVHPCACDVPEGDDGLRIDELAYQSADAVALRARIFPRPGAGADGAPASGTATSAGATLVAEIGERAARLREAVERYLDEHGIRIVHIRNIMSLPYNLPATLAFYGLAVDRPDIGFLMQHHDLYWEGPNARNFATPFPEVGELMERIMCPQLPNARHTLINPIAADALRERKHIEGTVIPDGFDFDRDVVTIDSVAFRERLAILSGDSEPVGAGDLVVAMPARVAINKSIELAIQLVAALDAAITDRRVVLLLPQGEDLEDNRDYFDRLAAYARHLGITLAYGGDIVVPDRRFTPGDTQHYPFYSTYSAVDLVCYPPEHEGFGNQAIEAVWARLPLAVFEYPVFERYVRAHIPHYISLGNASQLERIDDFGGLHRLRDDILARAVTESIAVLADQDEQRHWADDNVRSLRAFCGIDVVAQRYIDIYAELAAATREA